MSGNRGCLFNSILFLVIVFVPILGHIIVSLMILEDDHSPLAKILWLLVVWLLPPFVVLGPLLYLLFGQRQRQRVMFGHASYDIPQQQQML